MVLFLTEKAALKKEMEEDYQAQLAENAREVEDMRKAFEEKLAEARANAASVSSRKIWKNRHIPHFIGILSFKGVRCNLLGIPGSQNKLLPAVG